jgi:predicted dehydrogenase
VSPAALRVAIVGCGNIAGRHAAALAGLAEARLVAVSDIDRERAERFAAANGSPAVLAPDAVAQQGDIDAVVLCVPADRHAELGAAFARAGKHVLSEKPIDTDPVRALELIHSAARARVALSVVSQHRFHPDVLWLRELLASGALGRPVLIDAFSLWSRDQAYYDEAPGRGRHLRSEGGVLLNQAVHCADLMLWLFGPVASVASHGATLTHAMAAEDTLALSVAFESGALGTLSASTSGLQEAERLEVRCEKGSVVISGGVAVRCEWARGLELAPPPSARPGAAAPDKLEPFRRQHRDFAAAIAAGREPTVRGAEALAVLELILGAYRAAETGERVKLSRAGFA